MTGPDYSEHDLVVKLEEAEKRCQGTYTREARMREYIDIIRGHGAKQGDVWERLRVATIQESRLQAALRTIAQACGLGPGSLDSMSIDGITVKAVQLIKAGKGENMSHEAELNIARLLARHAQELEGRDREISLLKSHLRDRDEACERWAAKVKGLEADLALGRDVRDRAVDRATALEAKHIRAQEIVAESERLRQELSAAKGLAELAALKAAEPPAKPRPIEPWIHAPDIEKVLAKEFYADVSPLTRKDVGAMINIALRAVGVTY